MIPLDKKAHFLAGISLAALALPFGLTAAVLTTVIVGMLKEVVYDRYFGGTVDPYDVLATVLGAAAFILWIKSLSIGFGIAL